LVAAQDKPRATRMASEANFLGLAIGPLVGGVVFELFLVSTVTVAATRALDSRTAMLTGLALFVPSVVLLVIAPR